MSVPPYVEIAKRLKGLREALEFSPEELAHKLGVSPEEVLGYEAGDREIPVSYLFEVAKVCGVDLTVLIAGKEAHLHSYALVREGKGLSVERRKDYAYKSLAYKFSGRRMEPFLVTVPSKKEEELNFNTHAGQEFIYMLKGKLEIRLGDDVLILEPGDSLYFSSRTPHALRGVDGDAEFLDVIV
ncbi:MAG: XRE family transcriptional regulator [Desulfonauticus sp.]|nr:XRE family transcriptional regulator [Desulfonauticus sp.]